MKKTSTNRILLPQDTIFVFDIDGVLTNPNIKKPNPAIISFIAKKLQKYHPVAFATGRASDWIVEHILPGMKKKLHKQDFLDLLISLCEKGAVMMTFHKGVKKVEVDTDIIIPEKIIEKIKKHVESYPGVFFDAQKKTMVSLEIYGGNEEKIHQQKKELDQIQAWLQEKFIDHSNEYIIDRSEIAIDLQRSFVNKTLASKKLLKFLQEKAMLKQSFMIFGDSPKDALIAEEIRNQGYQVTFAYVGYRPLHNVYSFPVVQSLKDRQFDKAVVEILKRLQFVE